MQQSIDELVRRLETIVADVTSLKSALGEDDPRGQVVDDVAMGLSWALNKLRTLKDSDDGLRIFEP